MNKGLILAISAGIFFLGLVTYAGYKIRLQFGQFTMANLGAYLNQEAHFSVSPETKKILKDSSKSVSNEVYQEAAEHNPAGDFLPDDIDDKLKEKAKEEAEERINEEVEEYR